MAVPRERADLERARRVVVKVGSAQIAPAGQGPSLALIGRLAADLAALRREGREVTLVSSGAIASGTAHLKLSSRPRSIPEKQAAAAVGQSVLMGYYERAFQEHGIRVAQVLLTAHDIADRTRYLNARNTLHALLAYDALPIVNENDTVAVDEIKVGDNDNLAALVAQLIEADVLILLTELDGLYSSDPRTDASAERIGVVDGADEALERLVFDRTNAVSVGGMTTKLQAGRKAAAAGIPMVIATGREPGRVSQVLRGEDVGTFFRPQGDRLAARKRWIGFAVTPAGRLTVDAGAEAALSDQGRSLLPSGLASVDGDFDAGDVVWLRGPSGRDFARGLVNYASSELRLICRAQTRDLERILGYKGLDEVVHRDNMVIL
jgi:glutamate 5-kinase